MRGFSVAAAERFSGTARFEVYRRIGSGAFGVVYEAYDHRQNRLVAVKVLRYTSSDSLYRFKKGFRSLAGIRHPHLVSFHELLLSQGLWLVTMELVTGAADFVESVRFPADAHPPGWKVGSESHRLDFDLVREVLAQLSEGLDALHTHGRIHRDIKPSNVLVSSRNGRAHLSILDFGMVADLDPASYLESGTPLFAGSPAYMSPEQTVGKGESAASDWYSVGVMLYQALTGELPYSGTLFEILKKKQLGMPQDLRSRAPEVPSDLVSICRQLMEPDPGNRLTGHGLRSRLGVRARCSPSFGPATSRGAGRDLAAETSTDRSVVLNELEAALRTSRKWPTVVCLSGPSGIGKKAHVEDFLGSVARRRVEPPIILFGRCFRQESVPFKALDSSIDALSRFLMSLPDADAEALIPPGIWALVHLFPVLERIPLIGAKMVDLDHLSEENCRLEAFEALRELLCRASRQHPLVLSLDDLQWGDEDSVAWLAQLLVSSAPPDMLLIASFSWEPERQANRISEMLDGMLEECGSAESIDVRRIRLGEAPLAGLSTGDCASDTRESRSVERARPLLP